jgi:hypothetical protein
LLAAADHIAAVAPRATDPMGLRLDVKQQPMLIGFDLHQQVASDTKNRVQPLLGRHAESFLMELFM